MRLYLIEVLEGRWQLCQRRRCRHPAVVAQELQRIGSRNPFHATKATLHGLDQHLAHRPLSESNKFSPEVRKRAMRIVQEQRGEYLSLRAAIEYIASKISCVSQTLNEWVKRAKADAGARDGVTTNEVQRMQGTSHLRRLRQTTTGDSPVKPQRWWPDLNQSASAEPGAVQTSSTLVPRYTCFNEKAI